MNRPSDWRQRERARNPGISCIVQAPAGSGKTELLTQRLLALLAAVENPEEVVAITFTRKAAAEMRHRVIDRLAAAARDDQGADRVLEPHELRTQALARAALDNDREHGWQLLQQPGRLRIRTIDSLCSELARQLPILSGMGTAGQVSAEPTSLYRRAAERTLAAVEDPNDDLQPDIQRVLSRYDNQYDRLVELLTAMLGQRDQWLPPLLHIRTASGFDREAMQKSLQLLIESQLRSARIMIPDSLLGALPPLLRYCLENEPEDEAELGALFEAGGGTDCRALDLPASATALPHWLTLIRRLLTADGKKWRAGGDARSGFPAPSRASGEERSRRQQWKQQFKDLLDEHRNDDALREQLDIVRKLPRPHYESEAWRSLESLMRMLLRATQEWLLVIAETGQVDFSEVAARAVRALGAADVPSDLALRLDYRIRHLLVDEFQDTSHSQVRLLERLMAGWAPEDGHTLFLVGDPMQSIYRFRKAEVSLFIEAFEGRLFRTIGLEPLKLQVNFRAHRPLVEWLNQTFTTVMPAASDSVTGAVCYSPAGTRPDAPETGGVGVQLIPTADYREEARQVVEFIAGRDPGESIAILVRSRRHAAEIIERLDMLRENDARYRYRAVDFNPLATTPLIRDLVSLTLALTQPGDRLAWLAALRAPYTGLDLADLEALAGIEAPATLANAIADAVGRQRWPDGISAPGRLRIERIGPTLLRGLNSRGRRAVRDRVEAAWASLGGPACVHNASELSDAEAYFALLDDLDSEGLPIDRDVLERRLENLYAEPDAGATGRLQIMTLYAAKGLQFTTVIVPGLNRPSGSDPGKLLYWFELPGEERIVMSPMRNATEREIRQRSGDLIQFVSAIERQRQAFEDGRLLYVATTRAVRRLQLFASPEPAQNGERKPASGTLLERLWPALTDQALSSDSTDTHPCIDAPAEGEGAVTAICLPQLYRRLAADWQLPAPEPAVLLARRDEEAAVQPEPIEFSWAGEGARHTGNLVHRLLQLIAVVGLEDWERSGGIEARLEWCRNRLARDGIRGNRARQVVERTEAAVSTCLASQQGRWILGPHPEARCEYPITAAVEGCLRAMVLDRTFVDNGERWIIDYKTSSHGGGDLSGFLDSEAERYRDQLQRYRAAVALREDRPIRTALYFPLLDHFREI